MSSSSVNDLRTALEETGSRLPSGESLLAPIRTFAFWSAIALPFLYVPLLVAGMERPSTTAAFVVLLVANAVALLVGHSHRQS